VYRSETPYGPLFHARLLPGRENSGKLVTAVRRAAAEWAKDRPADLVLIDGPPGIGCPVIAASTGVDLALVVTEPTLSAIHDLERALQTASHFGIPAAVCINKSDLNERRTEEIENACRKRDVDVIGWIPYDLGAQRAVVARVPVTTCVEGGLELTLRRLQGELAQRLSRHEQDIR